MDQISTDEVIEVKYTGEGTALFFLSLKTLCLTVLTLGIYRFWMRARIRRYYWSGIRIKEAPLEFTGTGLEMFLGFLLAVVVLAIYLAIFQLLLTFAGMSLFETAFAAQLGILATIPVISYATYRARRYLLSRTRWRGIRFGMAQGAVPYMLRSIGYGLLSLLTLGILYPFGDFRLRRYVVDRSYFGDLQFRQEGHWSGFMRPWLWVLGSGLVVVAGAGAATVTEEDGFYTISAIGLIALVLATVNYSVVKFRYSIDHTHLGQTIRLGSELRTSSVLGVLVVGYLLLFVGASVLSLILSVLLVLVGLAFGVSMETLLDPAAFEQFSASLVGVPSLVLFVVSYAISIVVIGALFATLLTQPLLKLYAQSVLISGHSELELARQRGADDMVEAEGFADALDVGAAF